jgi:hypothetical protein
MKRTSLLLLAALLLTLPMLPAKSTPDSPASVPILLGLEPVRADLHLSSLQCALLDSLRSEYKNRAKQITAIGMAEQDAALRADWDLRDLRSQFNQRALNVLSPSQQDRLRQIERQMLGGALLTSVSEQQLLGLTPAQQASLAVLEKNDQAQAASVTAQFNAGKISNFRKVIALHSIQQKTAKKMLAVLTPKQKEHWEILKGQKHALPPVYDPNANAKSLFEGY